MKNLECWLCGAVFSSLEEVAHTLGNGSIVCHSCYLEETREFKAVLSTTVLPLDGTYKVETISSCPNITGTPHYIGHPDTKTLVESFGAVQAESKLFPGLQPGEQAVCFPIQQRKSTRASEGFTSPHQTVSMEDLSIRVITRVE